MPEGFASRIPVQAVQANTSVLPIKADPEDYFHIKAQSRAKITLTLAPNSPAGADEATQLEQNDLDLYLLNMTQRASAGFAKSRRGRPAKSLVVAQDGEYWLLVTASKGYSKYLLQVEAAPRLRPLRCLSLILSLAKRW